ncbi:MULTISPECIES: chaplin [unclassified Streptomyces]|uniref:chaplin n=1 Tax=unclassified Streptomyces TaxID=2593676 RepID=UPI00070ECCA9|nr:chaplin [Streptomyces sp. Root1310]KQX81749.1 chaplin [Streptomyces sp. Root1310]
MNIAKKAAVALTVAGIAAGASAGAAVADSGAEGAAVKSPGVISGNAIQVPLNIPINICGNTLNVVALLNPAFGNVCINR